MQDIKSHLISFYLKKEDLKEVEEFLKNNPNINGKIDENGETPLHFAASIRNLELVQLLLTYQANPLATNNSGVSPLDIAMKNADWNIVGEIHLSILNKGMGVESPPKKNKVENPSVHFGNKSPTLSNNNNSKNINWRDRFKTAILGSNQAELIVCLNQGVSPDLILDLQQLDTALHIAVKNRSILIIKTLLQAAAVMNKSNKSNLTPLQLAATLGYLDCIYAMAEALSPLDPKTSELFEDAICKATDLNNKTSTHDIVKPAPAKNENPPMGDIYRNAILNEDINTIEKCLNKLSPMMVIDTEFNSGLHYAIKYEKMSLIGVFLKNKANLKQKNNQGLNPIQIAVQKGNWTLLEHIIAIVTLSNKDQLDALGPIIALAVRTDRIDIIERLLFEGISPDLILDENNNTALHYAVQKEDLNLISLLLHHKASVTITNRENATATDLAANRNNYKLLKLLLGHVKSLNEQQCKNLRDFFANCIFENEINLVQKCVQLGLNISTSIDDERNSGLHYAVKTNNLDLVDFFLNTDLMMLKLKNAAGITPLQLVKENNLCLDLFVKKMENASDHEIIFFKELFVEAVFGNNLFVIDRCLKAGLPPDLIIDDDQNSSLHYALYNEDSVLIDLLLNHEANMYQKNRYGLTPIDIALEKNNWELIASFINKIVVDKKGLEYWQPILMTAFFQGKKEAVCSLVEKGIPLSFLQTTPSALDQLKEYMKDESNFEFIDFLLHRDKSGGLENYFLTSSQEIHAAVEDIFDDVILYKTFTDPFIFPSGHTFEGNIALQQSENPFTRGQITAEEGVKNKLVCALVAYYKRPWVDMKQLPFCLVCPETGEIYKEPVVALDGITYERQYLEKYLTEHNNKTPSGILQNVKPYPNRLVTDLITQYYSNAMIILPMAYKNKNKQTSKNLAKQKEGHHVSTTKILGTLNNTNNNNNVMASTEQTILFDGTICLESFSGTKDLSHDGNIIVYNNATASGKLISTKGSIEILESALKGPLLAKGSITVGKIAGDGEIVAEDGFILVKGNVSSNCEMTAGSYIHIKGSKTNNGDLVAKTDKIIIEKDLMGKVNLTAYGDIIIKGNAIGQGKLRSIKGQVICHGVKEGFEIIEDARPKPELNNGNNILISSVSGMSSSINIQSGESCMHTDASNTYGNSFEYASKIKYTNGSNRLSVDNFGQKTVCLYGNLLIGLNKDAEIIFNGCNLQPDENGQIDLDQADKYIKMANYTY